MFPIEITTFLAEKQKGNISLCSICNSQCCSGPGFALIENVIRIYAKYQAGEIVRDDYTFTQGLTLTQFISEYFDRTILNGKLMVFFPKFISSSGVLVSVPPWNYWEARTYLTRRYGSSGCIFLKKKISPSGDGMNCCILHNEKVIDEITEKPIDCIFLHCNGLKNVVNPNDDQSSYWFSLLNYKYPNSISLFKSLCPDSID